MDKSVKKIVKNSSLKKKSLSEKLPNIYTINKRYYLLIIRNIIFEEFHVLGCFFLIITYNRLFI